MKLGGAKGSGVCALLLVVGAAHANATPVGDAAALFREKKYAEAEAILLPLASAEPADPAACYYLGMTLEETGEKSGLDSARKWLAKAVRLAPDNEVYLSEFAGVCLLLADRDNSFSLAMEGSSAMTRAVALDPADLDAREGLMRFYAKAPWPLGDADKAFLEAAEIAKRDPMRGGAAYRRIAEIFKKDGREERAKSALREAQNLARVPPR